MSTEEKKLAEYRKLVEQMFKEQSSALISNGDTEHALILIETMIDRAKKSLDFFCKNLSAVVYDKERIVAKLVAAVRRGVKVRILTQEMPISDLKGALGQFLPQDAVDFRVARPDGKAAEADYNFVIMDATAFRFETDREKHQATACASNPRIAAKITKRFEEFWLNKPDFEVAMKTASA